jgi:Sugar-transfer associated ATP-grasp
MTANAEAPVGLTRAGAPATTSKSLLEVVARRFGVSPLRQFADMWRLKGGANQIVAREYYDYQLYRPDLSLAEKREFVGEKGSLALNLSLAPPGLTNMRNFLADKVGLTTLMAGLGLNTTRIQAAYAPTRGFGTLPTLRSAADVKAFLTGPARYPLFGKPVRGAGSFGSVLIDRIEGDQAVLGTGLRVGLDDLCRQIADNTDYGYVLQDAVTPHPQIAAMTGSRAVSTIRAVTVNETGTPRLLYALWKLPSATAMSDNFWQSGSLIALVDPVSGVVQKVRYGSGVDTQWVETHPVTGAALKGITLPQWQSYVDLACNAHAVVPDNGILGWDLALTPDGAKLVECNENTGHGLFQLASGRGVLNADFAPAFAAVKARNAALIAAFDAKKKAYQRAKAKA